MNKDIKTRCIHLDEESPDQVFGAISFPIFQTATFAHKGVGKSTGYDYSRAGNPTREQLEKVVTALESGTCGFAYASGMAAITAFMDLFNPGDHIIADRDLYGGSTRLFNTLSKKNGIEFTSIDCSDENISDYIKENTKAIFIETPTNPMMNVVDIEKVAGIAKAHGLLLAVDNTFLSPYLQNPLELGADIVIHSGTKFLSGHNDSIAGFLITSSEEIGDELAFNLKTTGAMLSPFDSWLLLRGIKTLSVRMDRAQENTQKIVEYLQASPYIKKVYYPGIETIRGYEIMKKQARGFGAMLTFEACSKEFALKVLDNVRMIKFAESLGGVESLITYPVTQTHADVPKDILEKNGITESVLRMSVGIESADDLIGELDSVFHKVAAELGI